MIYKISFLISGDGLWPEKIINRVLGDFIIKSYYSPTDKKSENSNEEYGYGGMLFWHAKKFSLPETISEYEEAFVFLSKKIIHYLLKME